MKPVVIDNNFFDQSELDDIKTKVFMLKSHWKSVREKHINPTVFSSVLTPGAYTFHFSEKEITANNEIMLEHFSYYYDKIKNKLSSYYNIPINYSPNLQFPGFHVFLNNIGNRNVKFPYVNFHIDQFPKLKDLLNPGKLESIIIPIVLPNSGGSLLYDNTIGKIPRNYQVDTDEEFCYTQGMMAMWPSKLVHSIAPFSLSDSNDMRLTMQMHVNLQNDSGIIFW